jgi:anhydro-N-acetylmuramic acid kinase
MVDPDKTKRIIGLLSGTSADGVSAVAVEITGSGTGTKLIILAFETYDYTPEQKKEVFQLFTPESSTVDRITHMNFLLGELFAEAALRLMVDLDIDPGSVDAIGSHGQTIHHLPRLRDAHGFSVRSTLQIGEPAIIAERTGVPVVADFRKADIAAGGEGAPLTPYLDYILHRSPERSRVLQNIGGIANLSYLPAGADLGDVVAFDTGPGNMVIDAVARRLASEPFDRDGRLAEKGEANLELLENLLGHPYFAMSPPKTTGREEFGESYATEFIRICTEIGLGLEDTLATATSLTVESTARAYEELLPDGAVIDEVYLSGGGAKNRFLVESLHARLEPIPVGLSDDLGLPGDAKEAVLMAVLANEHLSGNPGNVPGATGARRPVVLGAFYPGS